MFWQSWSGNVLKFGIIAYFQLGISGVNKKPFVCPFQYRQDRLQTASDIITCDRQFMTKQIWKNMC